MKCCGGLGLFGKCGRGTKKGCSGIHCKCMQPDCPNMHYVDCFAHYIHVEYNEPQKEIDCPAKVLGAYDCTCKQPKQEQGTGWEERFNELFGPNQKGPFSGKLLVEFMNSEISQAEQAAQKSLLKEMKSECDKTENEQGRLLVERFLSAIKE